MITGLAALAVGTITMPSASAATRTVTVTITGGHDTNPVDHGRPVVLIAAALGVPTEVFRTAFNGVTPAHGGGPTEAEARANKAALLRVLAPYGVTNARLDEVSNYYRYQPGSGRLWPTTAATATATVVNGVVTRITITNAGSGYSSPPTITVGGVHATATLGFSTSFAANGRLNAITLG